MGKVVTKRYRMSRTTILVLCLLALILLLRVWNLDADPPLTLSGSTDVYTDPPQYTLFAKMFVQGGDFNPFGDTRLVFFLKSSVTALATVVFKLIGTGIQQSNLVGLVYSYGGLLLFFLFLRKTAGNLAGVIYLILICFNYNQLFYGRLPFLENAMWFFASGALVLITHFRGRWAFLTAGASLAVAVFFGKILGVVFLFPFACFLLHQAVYADRDGRSDRTSRPLLFAAGFALIGLFWVLFSYLPLQSEVAGYIGEKTVELYGAPEGLQSFDDFVWKFVSFGISSNLFPRMTIVSILGAVYLGFVVFSLSRRRSWSENLSSLKSGQLFIAAMIVAFYGSLMIWNYQPLRYEMVLIYPFCGAAAMILAMWWCQMKSSEPKSGASWLFSVLLYPIALVVVSQAWSGLAERLGWEFVFDDVKYQAAILALVVALGVTAAIAVARKFQIIWPPVFARILVTIVVAATVGQGIALTTDWWRRPTYSAGDNSADLAMILSPGAVLSGPYAAQLTQSNHLGCVIHMFGVADVDSTIFTRFPITHLLLDQANETRARNDHPYVMGGAVRICTYHVGVKKVRLYRIAGHTGNPVADEYERSPFEMAVDQSRSGESAMMQRYLITFLQNHPENMSGYMLAGEIAQKSKLYPEAEQFLKKAVEFSPTNYNLIGTLAMLYKNWYHATGELRYKERALEHFGRALKYAPTSNRMKEEYAELKGLHSDD